MYDKTVDEIVVVSKAPAARSRSRRFAGMSSDRTRNEALDQRVRKTGEMKMLTKGVIAVAVVLAGAGVGAYSIWQTEDMTAENGVLNRAGKRTPVVLTPAKTMTFEDRIVVAGSIEAKQFALVSARIPGTLDAVYVDEGDSVEAGKTKLFQTDSLKLDKTVAMAEQGLSVAECSVREKEASLEQVMADKEQTEVDMKRYQELGRHKAVSKQLVEQQESKFKQALAMIKHAEALLALEKNKLEQARLSLTMTEKDLADSLVLSPISGRVSKRFKEPGEMAGAGTPVLRIEDLSIVEIEAFLPEQYYARVVVGQTEIRVHVAGMDLGTRPVTYKSPTVNPKLRTFEVEGTIESPPAGVVPGCLAEITIVMDGRSGVGVPTAAVQRRGRGSVVFVVDGEQARMIQVETGREMDGWTEIVKGELPSGTPVVTMGQHLVEDGTPVSVVKEAAR